MNDNPFEARAREYDAWYDAFPNTFRSELLAIRSLLPPTGRWVEIGVGTGRFAAELGIPLGVEPAAAMADLARDRGIEVLRGSAESLPLDSGSLDAVFFITTLCFVKDVDLSLEEAHRVLVPGGHCVIALLPLDSPLGRLARAPSDGNAFFKHAHLCTRNDVVRALQAAGFAIQNAMQTLFGAPDGFELKLQTPTEGFDRGSFVVLRAVKDSSSPLPSKQSN